MEAPGPDLVDLNKDLNKESDGFEGGPVQRRVGIQTAPSHVMRRQQLRAHSAKLVRQLFLHCPHRPPQPRSQVVLTGLCRQFCVFATIS